MANIPASDISLMDCLLFFISIVSICILHFLIKLYTNPNPNVRYPPSPPALPFIGHLHLVGSIFPQSFQALASRYGPLMKIRIGSTSFIVASTADVAKQILKTQDLNFASRFEIGPIKYNIYKGTGFITGPYGPYWKFMRKLCVTKLFSGAQRERFNQIRELEVTNLLRSLLRRSTRGESCNLTSELETLSNNLLCKMTMSRKFSEKGSDAKEMRKMVVGIMGIASKMGMNEVFGILNKVDLFGNGKKLREALWEYDSVMEDIMKEYEENFNGEKGDNNKEQDVMDILIETYRDQNAEVKLTRTQIKHFIIELLMASIDTSAAAIQWAMAELINHPMVFKKLRDEIEFVVGSSRLVKESDVPNLPYLQAIVKESLRLHTAAPIIHRECTNDCKINGFDVKAKSKILVNAYAIMRDPNKWHDPDEFMPERFLVNCEHGVGQRLIEMVDHDYSYVPFGGGRRGCIGSGYAYALMQSIIASLVQCFDWKVKDGEESEWSRFSGNNPPPLVFYPKTHFNPF